MVGESQFPPDPSLIVSGRPKALLLNGSLAGLTVLALVFAFGKLRHFRNDGEAGARVWFYDQNARRLYPAPRTVIPPDGNNDTRVRTVVIGFEGMRNDISQLKIAYLEKYSPELKALLERAQAAHAARLLFLETMPSPNSAYFQDNTLVKRPGEASWHTIGSDEARRLASEWREWRGPGGQRPIISIPGIQ